jgi:NADH:ubiquinone oxidoreductase subunit E
MSQAELREELSPLVGRYLHPQTALVPLLHVLLDSGRKIDDESMAVLAEICGVEIRSVAEIVGFYSIFQNRRQSGSALCLGITCCLNGAQEILDQLKADSSPGEQSLGDVTTSPCIGYCYHAPVLKLADGTVCQVSLSASDA